MLKRFILGVLAVIAASTPLRAQMRLDNEPQRPSAEAWNMAKYGEVQPSLYTGTVSVSIPLYHYQDADFNLPISLNYASNGCTPNVRPGMLGPDWTLSGGGCVTREIRGIPDNRDIGGYHGFHDVYDRKFEMDSVKVVWYNNEIPRFASCLYVTGNTIPYYDAEPDIFHFSAPGLNGSFHLGYDGKIYILTSNVNRSELKVEVVTESYYMEMDYFKEFKVTTGDGYVYIFLGTNDQTGNNTEEGQTTPSTLSTPDTTAREILKWNLSMIEAPNGRTVSYHYRRQAVMKSLRPYTYKSSTTNAFAGMIVSNPNMPTNALEYRRGSLLEKIDVDGQTIVTFDYMTGVSEKQQLTGATAVLDTNNVRLSRMKVWSGNKVIKTCSMSYTDTGDSDSGIRFLDSVFVEGEGTYSMTYINPTQYPALGVTSIDHWGYYNGKGGNNYLDVTDFNYQTKDEVFKANNCRIPDPQYARVGMLQRLTYPTGGYTVFTYEPHRYTSAIVRASATVFEPILRQMNTDYECGGLRISRIQHYDKDDEELSFKEYQYVSPNENGVGSGILVYMPRYRAAYSLSYNYYGLNNQLETGVLLSNNLTKVSDTHIEYSNVLEENPDGSCTEYVFNTSQDYPDIIRRFGGMDYQGTDASFQVNNKLDMDLINKAIMQGTSMQAVRGKIKSKNDYDSNGRIVREETTIYKTDSIYHPDVYIRQYEHLLATMNIPAEFIGRIDPSGVTTTTYYGNSNRSLTTNKNYIYNEHCQVSSISETGSCGECVVQAFDYVTDSQKDVVEAAMLAANVIAYPTAERTYVDSLLSSEVVYYFCHPDSTKARLFRVGEKHERDLVTNTWHITKYSYDKNGNILEVINPDGRKTCYLWGYRGMYPVAVIEGCGLQELKNITGFSAIEDGPFVGGLPASVEATLRSSAPQGSEVTTYEYEPLVGLAKATGPDGRKIEYSYNNAGKLMGVYDNAMRLRESYYYSTENK